MYLKVICWGSSCTQLFRNAAHGEMLWLSSSCSLFIREGSLTCPVKMTNCQRTPFSTSDMHLNLINRPPDLRNSYSLQSMAAFFESLSYRNMRERNYKAERIDEQGFSGWEMAFKTIQDCPTKWGRNKKRLLPHPHWATFPKRSCRDQNFNVLAFSFFISPGKFGGKDMVWSVWRQAVQHRQIKIPFTIFHLEQTNCHYLNCFPCASTLGFL